MSTSEQYINFVLQQVEGLGDIYAKKMFGEYLIYINQKPILLVCDNTVMVKILPCLDFMKDAEIGYPYDEAKEHYILDIEDRELISRAVSELLKVTAVSKTRKKKA